MPPVEGNFCYNLFAKGVCFYKLWGGKLLWSHCFFSFVSIYIAFSDVFSFYWKVPFVNIKLLSMFLIKKCFLERKETRPYLMSSIGSFECLPYFFFDKRMFAICSHLPISIFLLITLTTWTDYSIMVTSFSLKLHFWRVSIHPSWQKR